MPRLSVYTDPKRLSQFINRFWDAITLLEDRVEVIAFLKDLLTPTEIRMLAKRLQIADMLAKGYKYEDIRNYCRVTDHTITSVSNKLNYGEDGLIKALLKLEKIDTVRQNKLEGKKKLLDQPPGIGRAILNVASYNISKTVRHHKKVQSVLKNNDQ